MFKEVLAEAKRRSEIRCAAYRLNKESARHELLKAAREIDELLKAEQKAEAEKLRNQRAIEPDTDDLVTIREASMIVSGKEKAATIYSRIQVGTLEGFFISGVWHIRRSDAMAMKAEKDKRDLNDLPQIDPSDVDQYVFFRDAESYFATATLRRKISERKIPAYKMGTLLMLKKTDLDYINAEAAKITGPYANRGWWDNLFS